MYNDVLDKLMDQIPKDKMIEAQKHLTQKQMEKIGVPRKAILKAAQKFKYDDPDELIKSKNLIHLELRKVYDFIEANVKDNDKIFLEQSTKIPIEDSVICINDPKCPNSKLYYYAEQAYNRAYIYIYIKGTILNRYIDTISPLMLITVKLKDGEADVKFHKNAIGEKRFIKEKTEKQTACDMLNLFIGSNMYISQSLENRNTIYKKKRTTKRISTNISNNNYKYNKNKIIVMDKDKIVYEIDSEKNLTEFKRTYVRHIESWSVRSFDRHYKSGKVVHINAHTRGNKSVKADKKEYTLK